MRFSSLSLKSVDPLYILNMVTASTKNYKYLIGYTSIKQLLDTIAQHVCRILSIKQ